MMTFQNEFNKRLLQQKSGSFAEEYAFFLSNLSTFLINDYRKVLSIFNIIEKLKYKHSGSHNNYVNHLLRMCNLCFKHCPECSMDYLLTCLVHNNYEVTDLSYDKLVEIVGSTIANNVLTLTVDRIQQWDISYKSQYYKKIAQDKICSCIKVIDKLDNLFMIKTNPNECIQDKYLNEIKTFIIPLATEYQHYLPNVNDLLSSIVSEIYNLYPTKKQ